MTLSSENSWLNQFKADLQMAVVSDPASWMAPVRQEAFKALESEPLPHRRFERWRYTPVEKLMNLPLETGVQPAYHQQTPDQLLKQYAHYFDSEIDTYRMIVINGEASLLDSIEQEGVIVCSMQQAFDEHLLLVSSHLGVAMNHQVSHEREVQLMAKKDSLLFQHINMSDNSDGLFMHLSKGMTLDKPLEVVFLKSGKSVQLVQTHNLLVLEDNAEMTLIERHLDDELTDSFCNNDLEIIQQQGSKFQHVHLQQLSEQTWHRLGVHRLQHAHSEYTGWFGCCGSQWSRVELNGHLIGEHASSEVNGIQLANHVQVNDVHLDIRHQVPHCQSEQHFRGLAGEKSKIVFDGNIKVSPDAQKTSAHLSDKNLMLDRNSEVDAKPQLEIYADDVQCSHGTSIGELDEQQIFYLRSRGISEEKAKSLLSIGFVAQSVEKIPFESIQGQVLELIEDKLIADG